MNKEKIINSLIMILGGSKMNKQLEALDIIKKDILKGIVFGKKQEISYFVNHRVVSEVIKDKTKYEG